jgi:hypothetical protein
MKPGFKATIRVFEFNVAICQEPIFKVRIFTKAAWQGSG